MVKFREKRVSRAEVSSASTSLAWAGTNSDFSEETDQKAVFDYWYDLARKLGYCSSQEEREGEQWVCLSGVWERWQDAVERGYPSSVTFRELE